MFKTEKNMGKILKAWCASKDCVTQVFCSGFWIITIVIRPYQNSSKDSLRLQHWAGCVRLDTQTWRARQVKPVSVEPGVRKHDIPPLSKLHVVFASFLSHLRVGPIQCLHIFPLKLLGCFQSWVTATLARKRAGAGVCWTKVQCLWVFSPSDTCVPMATDFSWCPLCGVVLGWLK